MVEMLQETVGKSFEIVRAFNTTPRTVTLAYTFSKNQHSEQNANTPLKSYSI